MKTSSWATTNHLPFEDKLFDAVVLAHVLHLLEKPGNIEKLARVAKKEIVVFVRRRDLARGDTSSSLYDDERDALRRAFRQAAEEMGCSIPSRQPDWRERFKSEVEFLSSSPPSEMITIQDVEVVTTLGERISFFEKTRLRLSFRHIGRSVPEGDGEGQVNRGHKQGDSATAG